MATIIGDKFPNILRGSNQDDFMRGFGGDDLIDGRNGDDVAYGDGGDDTIYGGRGNDRLIGGAGNDILEGHLDNDDLRGGTGHDRLLGGHGRDRLVGNDGDDTLLGGEDNDTLSGGSGDDLLFGQDGDDRLVFGRSGADTVVGGAGDDLFLWKQGSDGGDGLWDVIIGDNRLTAADDGTVTSNPVDGSAGYDEVRLTVTDVATADALIAEIRAEYDGESQTLLDTIGVSIEEVEKIRISVEGMTGVYASLDEDDFNQPETTQYLPFISVLGNLEMDVIRGEHYALLTQVSFRDVYDADTLALMVDALDAAWEFYAEITGREPGPSPYMYDGLGTVAIVPESCGLGCGQIGAYGIEFAEYNLVPGDPPGFTEYLHDTLRDEGVYDTSLFYEPGRNFWFYGDQLGQLPGVATTYAVVNRYLAMETQGFPGAPETFTDIPFEDFRTWIMDDPYANFLADPTMNWINTVLADAPVPSPIGDLGGAGLIGGFMTRVFEDFGQDVYGAFWKIIGDAGVSSNPIGASYLMVDAANIASGLGDGNSGGYWFVFKSGDEAFTVGTSGDDNLTAGPGVQPITLGFKGNDTITGSDADDLIFGGRGNDILVGAAGRDDLVGGLGDDQLSGGADGDYLFGADGNDTLTGGDGVDRLTGGAGDDDMDGGADSDVFVFCTFDGQPQLGVDTLVFEAGVDVLQIEGATIGMFDTNLDGVVNQSDTSVYLAGSGTNLVIDIGLAFGGPAGVSVAILQDLSEIASTDLLFDLV